MEVGRVFDDNGVYVPCMNWFLFDHTWMFDELSKITGMESVSNWMDDIFLWLFVVLYESFGEYTGVWYLLFL